MILGKMVIMPIIGICSTYFLRKYFWDIPDEIDSSFYLVLMIVFITPTGEFDADASLVLSELIPT